MTDEDVTAEPVPPLPAESPPFAPQADLRTLLLAQFERWLDQMLVDEPPPRGLPEHLLSQAAAIVAGELPGQETDLYTLFAALTTLTGEIRLQGRAFKQLSEQLAPLSDTPAQLALLRESQEESAQSIHAALSEATADADAIPVEIAQVGAVMIDLFDRLQRGLQTCDEGIQSLESRRKVGWVRRQFAGADSSSSAILSVQALRDASALTLARLQSALQEWGIQRVGRAGEEFDPERMTVVEVRASEHVEPGTVVVVNRSGYAINGALKATAQVTVSKAAV